MHRRALIFCVALGVVLPFAQTRAPTPPTVDTDSKPASPSLRPMECISILPPAFARHVPHGTSV